jgi:hypothetical protein
MGKNYYLALASFKSKLRHCLVLSEITSLKVTYGGVLRTAFITKGEENLFLTERTSEEVGVLRYGEVYSNVKRLIKPIYP